MGITFALAMALFGSWSQPSVRPETIIAGTEHPQASTQLASKLFAHPLETLQLHLDASLAALLVPAGLADEVTICGARATVSVTPFEEVSWVGMGRSS